MIIDGQDIREISFEAVVTAHSAGQERDYMQDCVVTCTVDPLTKVLTVTSVETREF